MSNQQQKKNENQSANSQNNMPSVHCRRCGTQMENGVCKTCGFKMYVPMDKAKQQKIKLWGTGILMAVFVVLFVVLQFRKG